MGEVIGRGRMTLTKTGIESVKHYYAVGDSGTTPPTSGWGAEGVVPSVPEGKWLWMKTVTMYMDGTTDTSYMVTKNGDNGPSGKGSVWMELTTSVISVGVTSEGQWNGVSVSMPTIRIRTQEGYVAIDELKATCGTHTATVTTAMTGSALNDTDGLMLSMNAGKMSVKIDYAGAWETGKTILEETIELQGKATVGGQQVTLTGSVNVTVHRDGADGSSVVIMPSEIVLKTDENGLVGSAEIATAKASVKFGIGTNMYDATSVTLTSGGQNGCTAEIIAPNVIHITGVNTESVTLSSGTVQVSVGSGYVDFGAVLTQAGKTYNASGRLNFVVDVQKVTSSLIKKNSEITAKVESYKTEEDGKISATNAAVSVLEGMVTTVVSNQTADETRLTKVEQTADSITMELTKRKEDRNLIPFSLLNANHGNLQRIVHLENGKMYIFSGAKIGVYSGTRWSIPELNKAVTWSGATGDYEIEIGVDGDGNYGTNRIAWAQIEEAAQASSVATSWTRKASDQSVAVKNYVTTAMAVTATRLTGTFTEKDDALMGKVVEVTKATAGDLQLQAGLNRSSSSELYWGKLTDKEVTLAVIAKRVSSGSGDQFCFGGVSMGWDTLSTTNAATVDMGDGWKLYYIDIDCSGLVGSDTDESLGINTLQGTWQFGLMAVVEGGVPTVDALLGHVREENEKATGIYMKEHSITVRSDNFSVENNNGEKTCSVNEWGGLEMNYSSFSGMELHRPTIITSDNAADYFKDLDTLTNEWKDLNYERMANWYVINSLPSDRGVSLSLPTIEGTYAGTTDEIDEVRKFIGNRILIYNRMTGRNVYVTGKTPAYTYETTTQGGLTHVTGIISDTELTVKPGEMAILECCIDVSADWKERIYWSANSGTAIVPMPVMLLMKSGELYKPDVVTSSDATNAVAIRLTDGVRVRYMSIGVISSTLYAYAISYRQANATCGYYATQALAEADYDGEAHQTAADGLSIFLPQHVAAGGYTFGNGKKGYLPALGELKMIVNNLSAVNQVLTNLGKTTLPGTSNYASSTQKDESYVWYWHHTNGLVSNATKDWKFPIIAFMKE